MLIIVLFVLSPGYDVFNNYFGFVLGARSDFFSLGRTAGVVIPHTTAWVITSTGIFILWRLFAMIEKHPDI